MKWFCLRTQTKREHIAVAHFEKESDFETFCPRVRFQRLTARGKVWFTEAMFPGYLFARFGWEQDLRRIQSMLGISGVLHFGEYYPAIADKFIAELRDYLDDSDLKVFENAPQVGDTVMVTEGPMMGFEAVVTQLLPAKERVKVLLEFLGQPTEAVVSVEKVHKDTIPR
ncbi:MAG: transcription termination/antitermination protein NusG [Limisphaerales bacterium]